MQIQPVLKKFALLSQYPSLIHAFSTRKGGVSEPPFHYLNLGLSTTDDPERVKANRRLFFEALNIKEDRLVFPQQVHSANIQIVKKAGVVAECDALITDTPNLFLTVQTADCFPVFVFDPQNKVTAIIHSGWRGTAQNIVGKTIRAMRETFRCSPENILVGIGPGVQKSCYQIDEKTAQYFDKQFLSPDGPGHFKLDLLEAIVFQLTEQGVLPGHVERDATCTHCATDEYFSYRRDGNYSGRMMGVIGMVK